MKKSTLFVLLMGAFTAQSYAYSITSDCYGEKCIGSADCRERQKAIQACRENKAAEEKRKRDEANKPYTDAVKKYDELNKALHGR